MNFNHGSRLDSPCRVITCTSCVKHAYRNEERKRQVYMWDGLLCLIMVGLVRLTFPYRHTEGVSMSENLGVCYSCLMLHVLGNHVRGFLSSSFCSFLNQSCHGSLAHSMPLGDEGSSRRRTLAALIHDATSQLQDMQKAIHAMQVTSRRRDVNRTGRSNTRKLVTIYLLGKYRMD
jgi:hypothetical protein